MTAKSKTPGPSKAARAARGRVQVTVTLSPEVLDLLVAMAEADLATRSHIVEQAIRHYHRASEAE